MKRLPIIPFAAGALAAAVLSGCSALDGAPDTYNDSRESVTDRGSTVTTTTRYSDTAASTSRSEVSTGEGDRGETTTNDTRTLPERADSAADKAADKADEITDDVADGINGGLDATESIVDDVLR
ncbi:MAG: hypothetical protein K6B74_08665 [Ruminococcus sp.]|nr:hypothetical protein [Ruminococcus sp.]